MARILVVDDRPLNRDYLATLLRYDGHTVIEAQDGADALRQAELGPPDLIITDIVMPRMDGYDLANRIRKHPTLASTLIMFYTATYRAEEARALASTVGITHVLRKPSEPEDVLSAVRELLLPLGLEGKRPTAGATAGLSQAPPPAVLAEIHAEGARGRLTSLVEVLLDLGMKASRADILDLACRGSRALLGAEWVWIGVLEPDSKSFHYVTGSGLTQRPEVAPSALNAGRGLLATVLREGRPVRVSGVPSDPAALGIPAEAFPLRSAMGVPLVGNKRIIGCLIAANRMDASWFSDEDQSVAETIAAMAATSYENAALRDELERKAALLGAEITERRRAEVRERASESRYRTLFDRNLAAVFRGSLTGQVLECNEACAELLGFSRDEEEEVRRHLEEGLRSLNDGAIYDSLHQEEQGWNAELSLTCRNGSPIEVLARLSVVPDGTEGVAMVQGVMIDVTQRKRREERVRAARTMEAVRRLCSGAAHELEALGAKIASIAARGGGAARREPRKRLQEVLALSERVDVLTRLFKSLGERQPVAPRTVAIEPLLADLDRMLRRFANAGVEIATRRAARSVALRADPWHVEQVLLQLAKNANEAMPHGGKLTIGVELADVTTEQAMEWSLPQSGPHLRLEVSDTGTGMDAETRARVFEPFFSSKGRDRGLGLTTAYALVERAGGGIEIQSHPGEGTTVRVLIPISGSEQPIADPVTREGRSPDLNLSANRRTILVVEDDPSVRGLVREIVESAGHSVLVASDGLDALRVAKHHAGVIDLVLTDVIMPSMNGRDLVDRLATTRPDMDVLYMTGHREDAIAHQGVLEPGVSLIAKPFSRGDLLNRIESMLQPKKAAAEVL